MSPSKRLALCLITLAQACVLSVWFSSAAMITDMSQAGQVPITDLASLTLAVQIGFILGALSLSLSGLADRFPPKWIFILFAFAAALSNQALEWVEIGGFTAHFWRAFCGFCLAGVYPIGMKLVLEWAEGDRGFLVGLLVGALTFGTALSHLSVLIFPYLPWQDVLLATTALAVIGAILILFLPPAPGIQASQKLTEFPPLTQIWQIAWSSPPIRAAYLGYLGHMWELYAFWAWIAVVTAQLTLSADSFLNDWVLYLPVTAILLGALATPLAGKWADQIGKAQLARYALGASACAGLTAAIGLSVSPLLFCLAVLVWGATIIPDSAQFSALVAEAAPARFVGSLLTLQTALGFALTLIPLQALPFMAELASWPIALSMLAIGPVLGLWGLRHARG